MGAVGSLRSVKIGGIPFNGTADGDTALEDRVEITAIPHTGGNMMQIITMPGSGTAIKLTLTPSEYIILRGLRERNEDLSLSYQEADGSTLRSVVRVQIGARQSADGSCAVDFLTSTGVWDIDAAS